MPGHVCLETITFTERGDTTTVTQNTIYQSAQDRDQVLHCAVSSGGAVWQDLIEQAAWRSP